MGFFVELQLTLHAVTYLLTLMMSKVMLRFYLEIGLKFSVN